MSAVPSSFPKTSTAVASARSAEHAQSRRPLEASSACGDESSCWSAGASAWPPARSAVTWHSERVTARLSGKVEPEALAAAQAAWAASSAGQHACGRDGRVWGWCGVGLGWGGAAA
eukprot:4476270-Prymnesium_polylepis.1